MSYLKSTLSVKRTTTTWAVLRECGHEPLQFYLIRPAVKMYNSMLRTNSETLRRVLKADLNIHSRLSIELSHRHVTEPWPSARRATARRRSSDLVLVAGVEKKMPSIGGSHWEALSLMHGAKWQV
eukprot:1079953-Pelagomonas_calceolata.AAC.1